MFTKKILIATATVSALAISSLSAAYADKIATVNDQGQATTKVEVTHNADGTTKTKTIYPDGTTKTTTTKVMIVNPGTIMTGPGTSYEQLAQVPANADMSLDGCLATHDWCQVTYGGKTGWVSAQDLQVMSNGQAYAVAQAPDSVQMKTVEYDKSKVGRNAAAGAVAGIAAGAAVAGPIGAAVGAAAAVGGAIGAATGAIATAPDKTVTTYITSHPVPATEVEGTIKEGVVIPQTVTLTPVPNSNFAYFYAGNDPVIVNPQNRTVVRVMN